MGLIGAAGAKKAAAEQARIAKEVAEDWQKLGKTQYSWFEPYMQSGTQALTGEMQLLENPINQQEELATYYASPEYAMQEQQVGYAASSSAANPYSGMGGSATGNYLGSQSVGLGQSYLKSMAQGRQQQFSNLGSISKMGLSASGTMGNLATRDMQGIASAMMMQAAAEGQEAMAPYSGMQSFATRQMGMAMQGFGMVAAAGLL